MAASSAPGQSAPVYAGNTSKKRPSTDSLSSFGSPITFTARPASSENMEDSDKGSDGVDYNENTNNRTLNTLDEIPIDGSKNCSSSSSSVHLSSDSTGNSHSQGNAGITVHIDPLSEGTNPRTSTPVHLDNRRQRPESLSQGAAASQPLDAEDELNSSMSSNVSVHSTQSQTDSDILNNRIQVPILGYEVMEERARFTVYKVAVQKGDSEKWFIFRRYNDFVHLNDQLRELFPHFRLALPPKKWFGDNFDKDFIDDRMLGLQAFLNNIVGHRDVCNSEPVREFFCFEDPPGPHDSLEESKAMCEILEEELYGMKRDLREKTAQINLLKEELSLKNAEIENLRKSLRIERALNSSRLKERVSPSSQSQKSESSLPEALMESDQTATSSTLTSPGGQEEDHSSLTKDIDDLKLSNQNQSNVKEKSRVSPSGVDSPHQKAPSRRKDFRSSGRKDSLGKSVIKSTKKPMPAS